MSEDLPEQGSVRIRTLDTLPVAETAGLLDERAVAWYQAAALVRLAGRMLRRRPPAKTVPLLESAARLAAAAR